MRTLMVLSSMLASSLNIKRFSPMFIRMYICACEYRLISATLLRVSSSIELAIQNILVPKRGHTNMEEKMEVATHVQMNTNDFIRDYNLESRRQRRSRRLTADGFKSTKCVASGSLIYLY